MHPVSAASAAAFAGTSSRFAASCTRARALVTSSRTPFSWAAYPLTVSTRFGIRSARRVSCTSMPPSASCAPTSVARSLLKPTTTNPTRATTTTMTMMIQIMLISLVSTRSTCEHA